MEKPEKKNCWKYLKNKLFFFILIIFLVLNPYVVFSENPIQGKPTATQSQCKQWMKDKNVEQEFIDLIPYIYEECEKVNINPVLVITQSSLETGYYTSYLLRNYHNTAGIKKRGNTNEYQYYETYKEGFKAQINHLALYCGNPQNDYYYNSCLDGWVTDIEGLTGAWAEDKNYSQKILYLMSQIENYDIETPEKEKEEVSKEEVSKEKKGENIIYYILKKEKEHSKAYYKIFNIIKKG